MFAKSVALFGLAAMVSGRVIVSNTTTPIPTPITTPTPIEITPSATPSSGPITGTPVGAMTGPCTEEGLWNCVDGASFQRCASGGWSIVQPLAPGTHCSKGQTMNFEILPGSATVPTPIEATPSSTPSATPIPGAPAGVLAGPCTEEGLWNCVDGFSFQRCASGAWSVVQPIASGTKCTKGKTMDFQMVPVHSFMHRSHRIVV